jgi:lysine 6-dehydrogenase
MANIAVLGAGIVGSTIAADLSKQHRVTSFDYSEIALNNLQAKYSNIAVQQVNLKDIDAYGNWFSHFDIVVSAVPGFMGFATLKQLINIGKSVADISFFEEDVLQLDTLAKQKGVTVITDVGVAPGMSNFIAGRYCHEINIQNFEFYVGGLPKYPEPPFYYKAAFSPIDVIEEYTRPARFKEANTIVTYAPLSGRNIRTYKELGELEAFNTDGLRSLLYTLPIPNMMEQTLRYKGHVTLVEQLQQAGFFTNNLLSTQQTFASATNEILFKNWQYQKGEADVTIMEVICMGKEKTVKYSLYDEYDEVAQQSSMSRTTGFTCAAAAEMILQNKFNQHGVFPPELVGSNKPCFEFLLSYLKDRKVNWVKEEY